MFGVKEKINEDSLYVLNDMVENQVANAEKELSELSSENKERIEFLTTQIENYKDEFKRFKTSIENQLKESFQFSIEELYAMYGQYENRYVSIEFHKFSESAVKFGRNITGFIIYQKREREDLEKTLSLETVPRTNGTVKLDSNKNEKLSDNQKSKLLENGFLSGDVYQVSASNIALVKSYNQAGRKEIPNTMDIKFDSSGMDMNHINLYLFSQRINNGGNLIEEEWAKFCGLRLNFELADAGSELIKFVTFDEEGNLKPLVRFYELEAKLYSKNISKEEIDEFNTFLKQRRIFRTEQIKKEIKCSTNKTLEKFEEEYSVIYNEIQKSIIQFDTETLHYHETIKPIYWNYESFLHIYLRHCDELEIEGRNEDKTKFQYTQKDIKRILKIAIESLKGKINDRLKEGKEFRIWGDKSLYFNGNHYSLHILKDGRVSTFHPIENPEE